MSGDLNAATPFIEGALMSLADNIIQLYEHGARKFLVLNVPDFGKTPAVQALEPVAVAAALADLISLSYNENLDFAVQGLVAALSGIDISILDVYTTLNDVVEDPGTYGFLNATDACITPNQPPFKCKKPDTYVFWDGIHPTKALHAIIAQQAIAVISAP